MSKLLFISNNNIIANGIVKPVYSLTVYTVITRCNAVFFCSFCSQNTQFNLNTISNLTQWDHHESLHFQAKYIYEYWSTIEGEIGKHTNPQ